MNDQIVTLFPSQDRDGDSAEFAFSSIRSAILTGQIAPGSVLSQANLARNLGISRTPLREALSRLTSEGLILGGDYNRRMKVSELDLGDFDQIYALEPVAIMASVAQLDRVQLDDLSVHVEDMDAAIEARDMETFRTHHRSFHMGLTSLAGARIDRILIDLWDHSERYRLAYLHYDYAERGNALIDRLEVSQDEHRQMRDAAVAGDGETCASILVSHLTRTLEAVFLEAADIPRPRIAHAAISTHNSTP
jgi:DNA-binding GntR family transcriptional regulator